MVSGVASELEAVQHERVARRHARDAGADSKNADTVPSVLQNKSAGCAYTDGRERRQREKLGLRFFKFGLLVLEKWNGVSEGSRFQFQLK